MSRLPDRDRHAGPDTPGPTKRISTKELKAIWDGALGHLKEADAIVFVGYRFPPTDAEAREKLLSAIENNQAPSRDGTRHLSIEIVLGPAVSDDVVRLRQLVRAVLLRSGRKESGKNVSGPTFWIRTHRMYAEDFFTVWHPSQLDRAPQPHERVE